MSKQKPAKKKVVVTTDEGDQKRTAPATPRTRATNTSTAGRELTFSRQTYQWMGIGAACIALGLVLMGGGHMPSPEVWDPDIIYSFRRTVLAPIVILIGLCIEVYAIFKT